MKKAIFALVLFSVITVPAFAQMSASDLNISPVAPVIVSVPQPNEGDGPVNPPVTNETAPQSFTGHSGNLTPEGVQYREMEAILNRLTMIVAQLRAQLGLTK